MVLIPVPDEDFRLDLLKREAPRVALDDPISRVAREPRANGFPDHFNEHRSDLRILQ
jgi:hypothetical protein